MSGMPREVQLARPKPSLSIDELVRRREGFNARILVILLFFACILRAPMSPSSWPHARYGRYLRSVVLAPLRPDAAPPPMTAQLLADARRVLRSCAGGSAAQLAQRSLAQQVAHRLLELKARPHHTSEASRARHSAAGLSLSGGNLLRRQGAPLPALASLSLGWVAQTGRPSRALAPSQAFDWQAPLRPLLARRAALCVWRAARAGAAAARAAHLHRRPAAGARQPEPEPDPHL